MAAGLPLSQSGRCRLAPSRRGTAVSQGQWPGLPTRDCSVACSVSPRLGMCLISRHTNTANLETVNLVIQGAIIFQD